MVKVCSGCKSKYVNGSGITFHQSRKIICQKYKKIWICCNYYLSSTEVTTALRPFYFLVHPDFFAQYPRAQQINDTNLKILNGHLDLLINSSTALPVSLQFYVKSFLDEDSLEIKTLFLNYKSAKQAVQNILKTFKLPTNYVDKLKEDSNRNQSIADINLYYAYSYAQAADLYGARIKDDLYSWLVKYMALAEKRLETSEPIRKEINRLKKDLLDHVQLQSISWERGIGTIHLRGCLKGLRSLTNHYPPVKYILKGRHVHFGNETGVSLDGSIVLSTSEVRDQWHQVITRVPSLESNIQRIPLLQKAVSNALRDIEVTHRKYQPFLLAESYSQHLRRLVTSLGDFIGRQGFPKDWPDSLSHLQLVVESAAGPLMLSPTGQIIAPSSCPPWLLVNFITENMDEAERRIASYESMKQKEKDLFRLCQQQLSLSFLDKDDSISPELMIPTLTKLIENAYRLSPLLSGARLWVTHYYSVMLDGEVCIPHNWYNQNTA